MRTPYVEKMGTGILRINRELAKAGLAEAEFCFYEHNFSITFNSGPEKGDAPKGSPKTADLILELIRADSRISASTIGREIGISKRAIIKQTSRLKEAGKLRRMGSARGGHWEVIKGEEGSDG